MNTFRDTAIAALPNVSVTTMSSLEMVELINSMRKEGEAELLHKNFLAKVPVVLGEDTSAKFSADLPDAYGRPRKGYKFPKREACLMAMSYSYELQAVVYDWWQELESDRTPSFENLHRIANAAEPDPALMRFYEVMGFDKSMADISVNRLVYNNIGCDILALGGVI